MKASEASPPQQSVEILCKTAAPFQSRAERPCPIHQDVIFQGGGEPARLDSIIFRNHYVASVSIAQRQVVADASGAKVARWVAVLRDERLMTHPHFEDDAQSQRVLYTSRFLPAFDARLCAGQAGEPEDLAAPFDSNREPPVGSLRFKLHQPSMMWSNCMELRNLRTFMFKSKTPTWATPAAAAEPLADANAAAAPPPRSAPH